MRKSQSIEIIFVGASAGGVTAIQQLLSELPNGFETPIVFVQHLPADSMIDHSLIFSRQYDGTILEAIDKMPIEKRHIYFAPGGYHLSIEKDRTFSLSQDDPVHFARPSIDVLFESAAVNIGAKACAVLLTGANEDGASGLRSVALRGGTAIIQDPDEAETATMPRAGIQRMQPDLKPRHVGTLKSISQVLVQMTEGGTL